MSLATATLPTDPEMLRAFAARLQAELYAKTLHIEISVLPVPLRRL
jgi:transposase